MVENRLKQRIQEFQKAVAQLEKALEQPEDEYLRDATIQRFEFTYELAWKALKLWLATKDIDVRNAKDTWSAALQQGIIQDGNTWSELHRMRNQTSHTYDESLAEDVYDYLKNQGLSELKTLNQALQALA